MYREKPHLRAEAWRLLFRPPLRNFGVESGFSFGQDSLVGGTFVAVGWWMPPHPSPGPDAEADGEDCEHAERENRPDEAGLGGDLIVHGGEGS
jgi:hypothetical protein